MYRLIVNWAAFALKLVSIYYAVNGWMLEAIYFLVWAAILTLLLTSSAASTRS